MTGKTTPLAWRSTLVALPLVLCLLVSGVGAETGEPVRPIAMGVLSDGDLMLLGRFGGLFRLQPDTRKMTRLRRDFGPWQVQDMTVVEGAEGDEVYVTARWPVGGSRNLSALHQMDASGRSVRRWQANMPELAGAAVAPDSRTAYLTARQHPSVYTLDLSSQDATPSRLARIFDARFLGPLAIDTQREALYVADPSQGNLYRISLDGKEVRRIAEGLGLVSAVALSPDGATLYTLEVGQGRVISIRNLDSENPQQVELARVLRSGDPLALAVTAEGTIWVGDSETHLLSEYGSDGAVRRARMLIGP